MSSSLVMASTETPLMQSPQSIRNGGEMWKPECKRDGPDEGERPLNFTVEPIKEGLNSGRKVTLQAASEAELHEWMDALEQVRAPH